MNNSFLVTMCVKEYFDVEIQAADDECIFNFKDPEKARFLYGASLDKLNHPERYRSYSKREVDVTEVIEGVEP